VAVTLKLIQVYVTDKDGNPVTNLDLNDFVVHDNKKVQKITDFEQYKLASTTEMLQPQPEIKDKEPSTPIKELLSRKFFLFFDLANNNTKGFMKAQQAALHFIDTQLQPSDEVSILSFSVLKGLTLHEYFTRDRQTIRNVVKQIGSMGRVGRAENFEAIIWRELSGVEALDVSQASRTSSGNKLFSRLGRLEHKDLMKRMLLKITDLAKALRYIPGHKHILFFSQGIPYSLIHGIPEGGTTQAAAVGARREPATDLGLDTFLLNKYEEMLKELSNANTTVFSLNTQARATDMNVPEHYKGELTLRRISQYTGGKFLGNVQNYTELLDTVQVFTGSYYVLGYYVGESYDGRYHNIKVKVSRPGCNVFAQRGYFNPKMFSRYSDMEKEIHLIDLALSERSLLQTPLDIPMNAIPCPLEGEQGICVLAQIPGEKIREKIGKDAEIFFLVFDEKDNIVELKRQEVEQSALKGKEALYYSLLPLPPGTYKTSIVMRDMQTGESAVGRGKFEIPKIQEQGLQLISPLLLTPGKTDLYIRGYVPESIKANFPLLDYFPFDPEQYTPFFGEIPKNTQKIQAVLCCYMRNLTKPVLKFEATLIENSSGHENSLPVSILLGTKEGEEAKLLAEFTMPELKAGEY
jgi:VWFA-related protein